MQETRAPVAGGPACVRWPSNPSPAGIHLQGLTRRRGSLALLSPLRGLHSPMRGGRTHAQCSTDQTAAKRGLTADRRITENDTKMLRPKCTTIKGVSSSREAGAY